MSANHSLPSEGPADVVTATEARVAHAEEMTKKSSSLDLAVLRGLNHVNLFEDSDCSDHKGRDWMRRLFSVHSIVGLTYPLRIHLF